MSISKRKVFISFAKSKVKQSASLDVNLDSLSGDVFDIYEENHPPRYPVENEYYDWDMIGESLIEAVQTYDKQIEKRN